MPEMCANPLLLQWLKEWYDGARERNSKGATTYRKAYDSMKACPMRFNHPMEAQQLHGLGPKLCQRLTDKLEEHCKSNGVPMPEIPYKCSKRKSDDEGSGGPDPAKKQRKRQPKQYVPAFRSGAYGLLLGLLIINEDATLGLTKDELIEVAQPHSDPNFTTPSEPGKFFTAWNSMKTLKDKDLVLEHGRPVRRYMLTDEGREVALRCQSYQLSKGNVANHLQQGPKSQTLPKSTSTNVDAGPSIPEESNTREASIEVIASQDDPFADAQVIEPEDTAVQDTSSATVFSDPIGSLDFSAIRIARGTFDVRLVIDNREIRSTHDRDYISEELAKRDIKAITRSLPVGDALWVAKLKELSPELLTSGDEGVGKDEILLDHIVERKRLDDLIGSIKDGRFHEQKFRLRRSGVKNVTYLVENITISDERQMKYGEAVASAIASTQVVNGFFIKRTEKLDDTIRYLARMTKLLQDQYEKEDLYIIPAKALHPQTYLGMLDKLRRDQPKKKHYVTFASFNSLSSKSADLTLRDVYLKMLMCCRGVTGEKAIEIQKRWKTPRKFVEAFEATEDRRKKDTMVSDQLQTLVPRKKVAKQLSTRIAAVWAP
ncbi:putative dna repair protein [Phaeomoniella chlamydospora]|uniref:Crossover junction endonuclease MUS81 n=1 Tax=Phaeomoniella chlamydospora TaxID=158046 RepID=A0A0G2H264_PHACM|nr:putative dna repair protein [Phaeomoniella chlamydospora]